MWKDGNNLYSNFQQEYPWIESTNLLLWKRKHPLLYCWSGCQSRFDDVLKMILDSLKSTRMQSWWDVPMCWQCRGFGFEQVYPGGCVVCDQCDGSGRDGSLKMSYSREEDPRIGKVEECAEALVKALKETGDPVFFKVHPNAIEYANEYLQDLNLRIVKRK